MKSNVNLKGNQTAVSHNLVQYSSYLDSTVHLKVMFSVQVGMTGVQVYKVLSIGQSSRMQIFKKILFFHFVFLESQLFNIFFKKFKTMSDSIRQNDYSKGRLDIT